MRAIRKYFQRYWKYKIQQTKEELNTMKIGNDIYYVGVNDHLIAFFLSALVIFLCKKRPKNKQIVMPSPSASLPLDR